jgi:hypothetical protein
MVQQPNMCSPGIFRRHLRFEVSRGLRLSLSPRQAEAVAHPVHVGIDRHDRLIEDKAQQNIGRLPANAR